MGDDDVPTGVAPTELAAIAGETEAVAAWSLDDGEEWEPLLSAGYSVCDYKAQEATNSQIVDGMNSPYSRDTEQVIAETAIAELCPQYVGRP